MAFIQGYALIFDILQGKSRLALAEGLYALNINKYAAPLCCHGPMLAHVFAELEMLLFAFVESPKAPLPH